MSIRSALAYSFGTRYASMGLQFVATMILARLLTPAEIGIYSVGAALVMVAQTLRDFGTSNYIIQERELTPERQRTAFTLTALIAWVLAGTLWLGSGPAARFYGEPGVGQVLAVLAINFALIPFGSVTMALMRRDMNFRAIMVITIASTAVHTGCSVLLAALGYGFMSLAWGGVCGTLATVIGTLLARSDGFLLKPSLSEHRRVLAFSLRSTVSSIASEAGHAAPELVLGRTVGMMSTGLFTRAVGYVLLFERLLQDVIRSVMLPYLAEEDRSGGDVRRKIFQALENIASIAWFIIALTAILADPMILVLYGRQWDAAVPIAQTLCLAMAVRWVAPTLSAALVAKGQINLVMKTSLASTMAKFVLILAASPFGLVYGALGFTAAEVLGLAVLIHYTTRSKLFSWPDLARLGAQALPLVSVASLPAMAASLYTPRGDDLLVNAAVLTLAGTASIGVWVGALWLWDRPPKKELLRLASAARSRLGLASSAKKRDLRE